MANWLIDFLKRLFRGQGQAASPFPPDSGPARLLLLRHAEKTGEKSDRHLSQPGYARAKALANYIPDTFGIPDFLIAARSSKSSRRPAETLEPLAARTGLSIVETFDDEDIVDLVEYLSSAPECRGKFGVISWRHSDIPALAHALGAAAGTYPDPWPSDLYDATIEFNYRARAQVAARRIKQPF